MKDSSDVCSCPGISTDKDEKDGYCISCGKRIRKPQDLTDSQIEATFEVMAEEGAIWSGAR